MLLLEIIAVWFLTLRSLTRNSFATYIPSAVENRIVKKSTQPIPRNVLRRADQNCSVEVVVTKVLVLVPVYDYLTLDITNAPTSINTIYTGTSSVFITQSNQISQLPLAYTTHSSPSFSYVESYSFMLSMMVLQSQGNDRFRKRQGNVFLGGTGQATDSCQNAVVYNLVNGQLFANSSAGALQFGTTSGTTYANFTASASPGDITTAFSVDTQNNLMWSNAAFYNNRARFCVLPDNTIVAVFSDPLVAPSDCLFVSLSMTRVSSCAAAVGAPQQSGPAGPSGALWSIWTSGPSGPSGPAGATGATGPKGADSIQFAYLGCWAQRCNSAGTCVALGNYGFDSPSTNGGFNATLTGSATANIDAQCARICITKNGANFFGTVSAASGATADCYCGAAITGTVTLLSNCVPCYGQSVGLCGKSQMSIAVYARAF
ncbi:hypothetical protein AYO21_10942 [Fonsecaea monophora]|uniref:DUF7908 domain-containing protein n=1 Tax=Fonsecaea monophora TaxID=254056 RepID=A0A177EV15_9EURO|nr:hypothetical protein AYO21_10942 [Fonsecaea monophora]OAG34892.1 hypothetical protein AYO21_10942 [Fonsecaea monophora]